MSDENCDPSSIPTKIHPKSIDAQSAADLSYDKVQNQSSLDSPKSATITNVSQRLPSTSVEISVSEALSTNEKRVSVSIRDVEEHRLISSCASTETGDGTKNPTITDKEQSKMNLGEASSELTRLLPIENENTTTTGTHLNPDAPDFKPIELSSTYRSELAPTHLQRRATHTGSYDNHHSRQRYLSETHQNSDTSTIKPLLSIVPQYIPYNRRSWTQTTPLSSSSSSNSWWPQEYSNASSAASSYQSRLAYHIYSPLMEQQPLTDENNHSYNQQQHKYPSKRPRAYSGRAHTYSNQTTNSRKRSYSGPEPLLPPSSAHLNGIHSLTRIMVDVLRMINPIPEEPKETNQPISSTDVIKDSSVQPQYQQSNESIQVENITVNDEMSTTAAPSSSVSVNKTAGTFFIN